MSGFPYKVRPLKTGGRARQWCREQFGEPPGVAEAVWDYKIDFAGVLVPMSPHLGNFVFLFKNERDAIEFKLMFG